MELRHLRYFLALAERLSFTGAALQVHVTQSTLSHQIAQLEAELGQPLFVRSGRRVTLSAAGELFVPKAVKALAEIDSGIALLASSTRTLSGELLVGTTPTLNMGIVPQCIARFRRDHPSMHVMVGENSADGLVGDMRAGRFDAVVAYQPFDPTGLLFEPLFTEEMVLVVGPRHALAARKRVRMIELHRRELVLAPRRFTTRVQIDQALQAAGAEPAVAIEVVSIAAMLALVQQAELATIVSRSAVSASDGLRAIALEGPSLVRTPGFLWMADRPRTPIVAAFASIVRGVTREAGGRRERRRGRPPAAGGAGMDMAPR